MGVHKSTTPTSHSLHFPPRTLQLLFSSAWKQQKYCEDLFALTSGHDSLAIPKATFFTWNFASSPAFFRLSLAISSLYDPAMVIGHWERMFIPKLHHDVVACVRDVPSAKHSVSLTWKPDIATRATTNSVIRRDGSEPYLFYLGRPKTFLPCCNAVDSMALFDY